jgi:hypothetical protein
MNADDVYDFLDGFERISLRAACQQTRGRNVVVDVWFGKGDVWGKMEPSVVNRMWAGSSLCGNMLRNHFGLSDTQYARVMKDLHSSEGLPGIYRQGDHYVIVVQLPRRRSYEDVALGAVTGTLGGALAAGGLAAWLNQKRQDETKNLAQNEEEKLSSLPKLSKNAYAEEKYTDFQLSLIHISEPTRQP